MGRKKVDVKIRYLIKNCIKSRQRSFFVILGPKSSDQIVLLHHVFSDVRKNITLSKPSALWCFKKDNGFSFICKKSQKLLKKKYSGNYILCEEDCIQHFLASSYIQFCHYNDSTSVLGQTFDMLIIQDFEAVTPNILASIIECVQGGGVIIMILPSVSKMEEIPLITMDAHSRYITSAYSDIQPVFNLRFALSLADCKNCMILDDSLKILLCPSSLESVNNLPTLVEKPIENKHTDNMSDILEKIFALCCTSDQSSALKTFIHTLKKKSMKLVVSLTSARGRGKSATLGLSVSSALHLKYSNIYVISPQLENVQTLFAFVVKGIGALDYKEGNDYSVFHDNLENKKLISGISIFRDYKQVVKYIPPIEFAGAGVSDLVVIDEAAAIPLPIVKKWLASSMVFMASTINGYEGTGRSLSLKLLSQLRAQSQNSNLNNESNSNKNFIFHEISLNEAIRYSNGDSVEAWLNKLFCLDTEITYLNGEAVDPNLCQLYYVDKKVLFSYQKFAEKFLQQLVSLFVSSHYKNSPNDLLIMADAPSHNLFCLLPPVDKNSHSVPNVLCAIQIAFEGKVSKESVIQELSHGKRASGDMIPWIISQQFQDNEFPTLAGARIVRIATHPNYQKMGYGQHALQLLFSYFERSEDIQHKVIKDEKPTLLLSLDELENNVIDYVGVSYGLTFELLRFWKKLDFVPLYLRQTSSETTGEHSCVMIKCFDKKKYPQISSYMCDFIERFTTLQASAFKNLSATLALEILQYKKTHLQEAQDSFSDVVLPPILKLRSIKRLEAYCNHLVDYHLIMDLIPILSRCYFLCYFKDYFLSSIQEKILLSIGLQNKSVEDISQELDMETNQVMGFFLKIVKKLLYHVNELQNNNKGRREESTSLNNKIQNKSFHNHSGSKRKWKESNSKKAKKTVVQL